MTEIAQNIRKQFPHGAPEFIDVSLEEMQLYSDKNHDYAGDENPFGNFERVAVILSLYPGLDLSDRVVVALVYMMKQLDAVLRIKSDKTETKVESIESRLADISVYAKIARIMEGQSK